jgi:hypothetical protein
MSYYIFYNLALMKAVLHKILSLVMALVVLFSTTSFTVNMHYCGDYLVDMKIYQEAEGCGMEIPMTNSTSETTLSKTPCCKNEQLLIPGQDELQTPLDNFSFSTEYFVVATVYSYINLFESLLKETIPFKEYVPPNLVFDIQVLDQVFII